MKRHFQLARSWGARQGFTTGLLLLLAAAVLLVAPGNTALGTGVAAPGSATAPGSAAAVPHLAGEKPRFYITNFSVQGDGPGAACAPGYHMASLWEIFDPSERTYAADLADAKTRTDQGSGPVAGWWGWVRTGVDASVANQAGQANCSAWTSNTTGQYGSIVRLSDNWTAGASAISPWEAQAWSCVGTAPVWCASDPVYGMFIPHLSR